MMKESDTIGKYHNKSILVQNLSRSNHLNDRAFQVMPNSAAPKNIEKLIAIEENNVSDCDLNEQEWMNTKEAAEYLRISPATLRNLTSNGKVPYHKLERRNRYLKVELRDLLLSNARGRSCGY